MSIRSGNVGVERFSPWDPEGSSGLGDHGLALAPPTFDPHDRPYLFPEFKVLPKIKSEIASLSIFSRGAFYLRNLPYRLWGFGRVTIYVKYGLASALVSVICCFVLFGECREKDRNSNPRSAWNFPVCGLFPRSRAECQSTTNRSHARANARQSIDCVDRNPETSACS
jgi:hypothetical protein